jgi:hypothetical protein
MVGRKERKDGRGEGIEGNRVRRLGPERGERGWEGDKAGGGITLQCGPNYAC